MRSHHFRPNLCVGTLLLTSSLLCLRLPAQADVPSPSGAAPAATSAAAPQAAVSTINLTVYIVDGLTPKPVPLTDFVCVSSDGTKTPLRTDMEGKATAALAPGHYRIQSNTPLDYEGHTYTWGKDIDVLNSPSGTDITLTQSDATVVADASSTAPGAASAAGSMGEMSTGTIFKLVGPSVFAVQGTFGDGSGFLVDAKTGLILTCGHVVDNSQQLQVRVDSGKRYSAQLVTEDKDNDIAIVKVNPAILPPNAQQITLRDTAADPVSEGDTVIAIGWPLDQHRIITQGIVSRVESDAIISDVNINHGSSGGPLLDTQGRAVGITTFIDSAENGPGISGITAIAKAVPILAQARQRVADGDIAEPAAYQLPDISDIAIEPAALEQAQMQELHPWFIERPKNFQTMLITPYVLASMANANEREMAKGKSHRVEKRDESAGIKDESDNPVRHFWDKYVGADQPVVLISINPALKEKSGSLLGAMFTSMINVAAGARMATQRTFEFRDDFYDMQLWRGNHLVLPVASYRTNSSQLYESEYIKVNDEAYGGLYGYDPSAFEPSERLVVKMRRESNLNNWDVIPIDDKTQLEIWDQFAGYRLANPAAGVPTVAPAEAELAAMQQLQAGTIAKSDPSSEQPQTSMVMAAKQTSYPVATPINSATVTRFVLRDGTVKNGVIQRQQDGLIFISNNLGTDLVKQVDIASQTVLPPDQAQQYLPK